MNSKEYREAYDEYMESVEELKDDIRKDLPEQGKDTLDGRMWCTDNRIPETMFADAINHMEDAEYGVSPMYPWRCP